MKTRAQAFLSGAGGDGGRQRTSGFGWRNKNSDVTNTFLSAINGNYYYHPNSSPKDWTDYDGFQTGQLVATCAMHAEMFSTVNGASWGGVSGPFTYSADFVLPDGSHANLQRLTRGGITVTTLASLVTYIPSTPGGAPQVVDLTTGKGPFVLGACAVMIPFSGPGFNPAGGNLHVLDKPDTVDSAKPDSK